MIIIDTNVYSALLLGNTSAITAISGVNEIAIPLFCVAELRYGFINGSQATTNEEKLQKFLGRTGVSVIFPTTNTSKIYAEMQLVCKNRGRALSQNDLWIAAVAIEGGYTLLTFDNDFSVFSELFGNKLKILS